MAKITINEALRRKGVKPCSMCGAVAKFEIVGPDMVQTTPDPSSFVCNGVGATPAAIIKCTHCGLMTWHDLRLLGYMPVAK